MDNIIGKIITCGLKIVEYCKIGLQYLFLFCVWCIKKIIVFCIWVKPYIHKGWLYTKQYAKIGFQLCVLAFNTSKRYIILWFRQALGLSKQGIVKTEAWMSEKRAELDDFRKNKGVKGLITDAKARVDDYINDENNNSEPIIEERIEDEKINSSKGGKALAKIENILKEIVE
ncbi:MAG: hypothetical protein KBT06_09165 [Prevotellaceae bacterium]|nr:hypothetical protein [Candidatus Colivivens equi]